MMHGPINIRNTSVIFVLILNTMNFVRATNLEVMCTKKLDTGC